MNSKVGRLATIISEALLLVTQNKIYGVVVLDINIEKRLSFSSGPRNEKRCTEDSCRANCYLLKRILDSHLGSHQENRKISQHYSEYFGERAF